MTPEENETRLKRITQLADCPGWTEYLRPRISDKLHTVERTVLENEKLTADEVMLLRAEARAYRTILGFPDQDAKVSQGALKKPAHTGRT